jgi:carbon-monoxide dehydrogenase small subunit
MIMTAVDMIGRYGSRLDAETVRRELDGNLCRCTGYQNIVKAVKAGLAEMK